MTPTSYVRAIALQPDLLFVATNTSMAALHAEHSNISTVFAMVSDPVGMRYVESFSRPGGNVTGFTPFEPSLGGKWVALIKEMSPNVEHMGEPGNRQCLALLAGGLHQCDGKRETRGRIPSQAH